MRGWMGGLIDSDICVIAFLVIICSVKSTLQCPNWISVA